MKNIYFLIVFVFVSIFSIYSENRVALVIGNGNYSSSPLKNPVKDAKDMASTLKSLNFEVILLTDSTRRDILSGFKNFGRRLTPDSVGLFYYAGHGTQIENNNYLIPIGANIETVSDVEFEGVMLKRLIRLMEDSKVNKSLIFLDACRDNPYASSSRSGTRGLTVVSVKSSAESAGSLISFATSPGSVAADGDGDNGTFTTALLKYMKEPGLEINQVMTKVRADVMGNTNGKQQPWTNVSLTEDFFFIEQTTYNTHTNNIIIFEELYGSLKISVGESGELYLNGKMIKSFSKGESVKIPKLITGTHNLEYISNGRSHLQSIVISENKTSIVKFLGKTVQKSIVNSNISPILIKHNESIELILVKAGTFEMGSKNGDKDEKPAHNVQISMDFYIGKYEVTQMQWKAVMSNNPSSFRGDYLPVEQVSWIDSIVFCNKLSVKEGLIPAYLTKNKIIAINKSANGYRLPTEAEWEFAANGGNSSRGYKYAGSNSAGDVGWYSENAGKNSHNVGTKQANELGIYDMSGNVYEWCWDWKGSYSGSDKTDFQGSSSGSRRVMRGGSWRDGASGMLSAFRSGVDPDGRLNLLGFRLVRPIQ